MTRVLLPLVLVPGSLLAQSLPSFCLDSLAPGPAPDLYCLELVPRPEFRAAGGVVELRRVVTPFDVAVTADGGHLYDLVFHVSGLPEPATLGPYRTYVAWIAPPVLSPLIRLGEVRNGTLSLGRTSFDKFVILISAESTATVSERSRRLVLRGNSPSTRMQRHDLLMIPPSDGTHRHHAGWRMPPMDTTIPMYMPGIEGLGPTEDPYLPGAGRDPARLPAARPREVVDLSDGDTLRLEAGLARRTIRGQTLVMYAFNGQYPGPLLRVTQGASVIVEFVNTMEEPTAVHWHGLRLENRSDGVVGVTQDPVPPGGRFVYRVSFPDAGIYWYHPHMREDVQQDLGLYGNLLVRSPRAGYLPPVHREELLILDDLLLGEEGLVPYGRDDPIHALMGRFGNVLLVNGETDYRLAARRGEVVRFHLTNASNTRPFNVSFAGARMKLVAGDVSKFEREEWVESVVIAPAQRYVVDVRFDEPGVTVLLNRVQAVNHSFGYYFPQVDTLGRVTVSPAAATPDLAAAFAQLRTNADMAADLSAFRRHFDRAPDKHLVLTVRTRNLPFALEQILQLETSFFPPVEWSGTMPMMDWLTSGKQASWILRDGATGRENMAIDWTFRRGDVIKIRIVNDRRTLHAMAHPVHLHGQRFLVLSQDGVPNGNLVWKDTVLLPVGTTADILVEMSNPGRWAFHCHIAEHLHTGMMAVFEVR